MLNLHAKSLESNDPEFDDYNRKFTSLEASNDRLIKDCKVFSEAVISAAYYKIYL